MTANVASVDWLKYYRGLWLDAQSKTEIRYEDNLNKIIHVAIWSFFFFFLNMAQVIEFTMKDNAI